MPAGPAFRVVVTTPGGNILIEPEKLTVEKQGDHFVFTPAKPGQWLIIQYREGAGAKPVTARFEYDTKACGECKKAEWLCVCGAKKEGK